MDHNRMLARRYRRRARMMQAMAPRAMNPAGGYSGGAVLYPFTCSGWDCFYGWPYRAWKPGPVNYPWAVPTLGPQSVDAVTAYTIRGPRARPLP